MLSALAERAEEWERDKLIGEETNTHTNNELNIAPGAAPRRVQHASVCACACCVHMYVCTRACVHLCEC